MGQVPLGLARDGYDNGLGLAVLGLLGTIATVRKLRMISKSSSRLNESSRQKAIVSSRKRY